MKATTTPESKRGGHLRIVRVTPGPRERAAAQCSGKSKLPPARLGWGRADQLITEQDDAADMAIVAVPREYSKRERALDSRAIRPRAGAGACRSHAPTGPAIARRRPGRRRSRSRRCACCARGGEQSSGGADDHQEQEGGHRPTRWRRPACNQGASRRGGPEFERRSVWSARRSRCSRRRRQSRAGWPSHAARDLSGILPAWARPGDAHARGGCRHRNRRSGSGCSRYQGLRNPRRVSTRRSAAAGMQKARARSIAAATEPKARMGFSASPRRIGDAVVAAAAHAHRVISARCAGPGMVLRASRMVALVPRTASTWRAVVVAVPLRVCCRKFSDACSAVTSARLRPAGWRPPPFWRCGGRLRRSASRTRRRIQRAVLRTTAGRRARSLLHSAGGTVGRVVEQHGGGIAGADVPASAAATSASTTAVGGGAKRGAFMRAEGVELGGGDAFSASSTGMPSSMRYTVLRSRVTSASQRRGFTAAVVARHTGSDRRSAPPGRLVPAAPTAGGWRGRPGCRAACGPLTVPGAEDR